MFSLMKGYSEANPEKFNEEFIYLKKHDDVLNHINNILKSLEIINGVEFLESELITDESKIPDNITKENTLLYNIEESRLNLIRFKFKLTAMDKNGKMASEEIERFMFFPKLIDNFYFVINGNRFSPIYQILDSDTYRKGSTNDVTLKTLLMGITICEKNVLYKDIHNTEYDMNILYLNIFSYKINYLLYYLASFNWEETLKFFEVEKYIKVLSQEDYKEFTEKDKYVTFEFNSNGDKLLFKNCLFKIRSRFCLNFVDLFKVHKITAESYNIIDTWITLLGKYFSKNKNSYESKAKDILISFKRILDDGTRRSLKLKEENKKDVYTVVKWLVNNYDTLKYKDNMDLKNKRIRVYEYLLYPLTIKFSHITYRLLNKSELTLQDLKQLFSTVYPMTIMKSVAKDELLRYNNAVNTVDIFNSNLKFSHRGKQALGEGNKQVQIQYRGHHPSYIGRIGLTAASSSDPGMTGSFTPFLETKGFYFDDELLDDIEFVYDDEDE